MRKNSIKNIRINEEVMRELSNIIRGEIKDPRINPMTSVVAVVRKDLAERWLLLYVITVPAGCTRLSLYTAGKGTYVIGNVGHVDTQELRHGQG